MELLSVLVGVVVGVERKKRKVKDDSFILGLSKCSLLPVAPALAEVFYHSSLEKTTVVPWSPFFFFPNLLFSSYNPFQNYLLCYPINLRIIFLKYWIS